MDARRLEHLTRIRTRLGDVRFLLACLRPSG